MTICNTSHSTKTNIQTITSSFPVIFEVLTAVLLKILPGCYAVPFGKYCFLMLQGTVPGCW